MVLEASPPSVPLAVLRRAFRAVNAGFHDTQGGEKYGQAQEAGAGSGTYVDPRAGRVTLIDWVNVWYPAQDLEPTTLVNYKYAIEVHILPKFGIADGVQPLGRSVCTVGFPQTATDGPRRSRVPA